METGKITRSKGTYNGLCTDWADNRLSCGMVRKCEHIRIDNVHQPKVASIIAIQPGIQGDGHVAVVERIESASEVYTSDWNYNGNSYDQTDSRQVVGLALFGTTEYTMVYISWLINTVSISMDPVPFLVNEVW
ncbi:hypothetical protein K493DRAFT_300482 [Basidiobolus meristosporus CBS 931.73]|uniref:Peptidase C51 domain-containing protein n=1 Tax=Basidiobolus meristosporus CBS 931.73 TaxID=1314790 RepID=A0A1Y1YH58_9FUNG|nr:hypothetical protein K493DRAFT_300482 [Basidiobolus meristosporus CBS 931.73]|eukprot:ORX97309.1 hypothetical protein K493DRAFT_300482 [Basidiobolus meristosporus CBS 931.73]